MKTATTLLLILTFSTQLWAQDLDETDELIQNAVNQLIQFQEEDGAWPYEGVYRVNRKIPVGYRIGGTSIVSTALLYATAGNSTEKNEAVDSAIGRGIEIVLSDLENPRMELSTANRYDVRVWGHIYALDFFCRLRDTQRFEDQRKQTDAWIPKLVEILTAEQLDDGGWNYATRGRHAAFVTSPAVQALLLARQQGEDVPDEVFEKAKQVLLDSRTKKGAFQYSGVVTRRPAPLPGSIARSALCELTLVLLGEGDVEQVQDSINAFHEHWDELEKRRAKTGTHEGPYGIAPYYFYFGHRYIGQAVQLLAEEDAVTEAAKLKSVLMKTKSDEDTWNDRVFDRSKAYGTAMSVLALLDNIPLPEKIEWKK